MGSHVRVSMNKLFFVAAVAVALFVATTAYFATKAQVQRPARLRTEGLLRLKVEDLINTPASHAGTPSQEKPDQKKMLPVVVVDPPDESSCGGRPVVSVAPLRLVYNRVSKAGSSPMTELLEATLGRNPLVGRPPRRVVIPGRPYFPNASTYIR